MKEIIYPEVFHLKFVFNKKLLGAKGHRYERSKKRY